MILQAKHRFHPILLAAAADHIQGGSPPQHHAQRIDHNRFASAGFPRQHIKAAGKFDFRLFDQRKIKNFEYLQQMNRLYIMDSMRSFTCSTALSGFTTRNIVSSPATVPIISGQRTLSRT